MAMVIKGNSLISVPDNRVEDYLARGYSIADEAGTVIKKAVPTDIVELQKLYTNQVAEIVNLKKQLAKKSDTKGTDDSAAELEAVKAELAETKESYEALLKTCEELAETNNALETEIEKLKAPKKTRAKKSE